MLCGDETNAVVVDIGTYDCRFGSAGQDLPRYIFRNQMYELPDEQGVMHSSFNEQLSYHPSKPISVRSMSTPPATSESWIDIEQLLRYGIEHKMKVLPAEQALLFSISSNGPLSSSQAQRKLLETSFETLSTPALFCMPSSVLSSVCLGRRSSLVIDIGASSTSVSAVVDGHQLRKSIVTSSALGSNQVDIALHNLLQQKTLQIQPQLLKRSSNTVHAPSLLHSHRLDLLRDIKSALSFIPHYRVDDNLRTIEGLESLGVSPPGPYTLPDGTIIQPEYNLCCLGEAVYFDRSEVGLDLLKKAAESVAPSALVPSSPAPTTGRKRGRDGSNSSKSSSQQANNVQSSFGLELMPASELSTPPVTLPTLVLQSLAKCDIDCRRELLANIVLVGGGSLLSGLPQRLQKELEDLLPLALRPKVIVRPAIERRFSSWIGGSILGICGSFQQVWVSRQQYDEEGAERIVEKRFIY